MNQRVSVGQFMDIISRIADMRAENGAEQNRVMQRIDLLSQTLLTLKQLMVVSWTQILPWSQPALPDITSWCRQVPQ